MDTWMSSYPFSDPISGKSNQKNLGTIRSSNLCTEIMEYSSPDETAMCNLASVALSSFIWGKGMIFRSCMMSPRHSVLEACHSNICYCQIGIWCSGSHWHVYGPVKLVHVRPWSFLSYSLALLLLSLAGQRSGNSRNQTWQGCHWHDKRINKDNATDVINCLPGVTRGSIRMIPHARRGLI